MDDLRRDLAYALRRLRAAPAFALTAVLTMALGIGANTAIFSIVNGVLLRPLPFHDPDRLFAVYSSNRTGGLLQASVSAVDLDDWRAERQSIEDIGGYLYGEGSTGVDLTGRGDPRRLSAVFVSPGFFSTLGVTPQAGRLPREDEMVRGGHDTVVMITAGFWSREFGASPSVVGSTITLNGVPYDVLGVLPEHFRFPTGDADVFVPVLDDPRQRHPAHSPRSCAECRRAGQTGRDRRGCPRRDDGDHRPACRAVSRGSRVGRGDGRAARRRHHGAGPRGPPGALRCGRARAPHCERERRRAAVGARDGARPGDRGASCLGRATRTARPPASHRKPRRLAARRCHRSGRREARHRRTAGAERGTTAARGGRRPRRDGRELCAWPLARERSPLRHRAGAPHVTEQRADGAAGHQARRGRARQPARPRCARRRRSRGGDGARRRRGTDEPELHGAAGRGRRLQARSPAGGAVHDRSGPARRGVASARRRRRRRGRSARRTVSTTSRSSTRSARCQASSPPPR